VAKGALVGVGLVLIVAGGAGLGYGVTRKSTGGMAPEGTAAMGAAVSSLDGDIKAARTAVHERAGTLAQFPALRAAVGTDAATAQDMARDAEGRGELAFKAQPGEVIEIGQTPDGGKPQVLLTIPPTGMKSSHDGHVGQYAELAGDQVLITEVVEVKTTDPSKKLTGFVTVSRPLDLKGAIDRLTAAGIAGRVEIAGKTRAIGTPAPGSIDRPMKLPSQPDAQLVVAEPPVVGGMPMTIVGGGAAAAGLGLVVLLIGLVTGRRREPEVAGGATRSGPTMPGVGDASRTKLTAQPITAVASGTPAPVHDLGSQPINIKDIMDSGGGMIGRWEVVRRIGSGGMADVFLARSRGEAGFEKLVAIKVMHGHLARNGRAVELFLDEARVAARIHHPNVVAIQDLGKIGDDYVIVMEYVDGVDLEKLLANARVGQRQVPLDVGLGILCRICDGLQAAHTATAPDGQPLGVIHRDVKSANVLISRQGVVKVVDFGIAKAAKQGHYTAVGETKGTPSMMAPEQRVGEEVDVRADVYAVAAVGYEVVTGHGVNLDLAALAHLGIENWPHLPVPSSLRADLPRELDDILLKTMSFERDKRPASCAALEDRLATVMKTYGLSCSDKDIARWVQSELALLHDAPPPLDAAQTSAR